MGKPTGVGASLLGGPRCVVSHDRSSVVQIVHEAKAKFEDDLDLVAELSGVQTRADVIDVLQSAHNAYRACPDPKDQKRAAKIMKFMDKHKLPLGSLASC